MSQPIQIEFARLVDTYYQRHRNALALTSPSFETHGFISKAVMAGSGGSVEIPCGPAEYHAEIFINVSRDQRRWSLADLMTIESVRHWMLHSRPNTSGKTRLEAEIEVAFCLLVDGLKNIPDFEWLHSSSASS